MQPIDSKETYPYGTSKDLASEKKKGLNGAILSNDSKND